MRAGNFALCRGNYEPQAMWLIDENLHIQLHKTLAELGVKAQTVSFAGLSGLDNGILTRKAFEFGFRCILTQDKDFPKDAARALRETPEMAVVIIKLAQTPAKTYLERFKELWWQSSIAPIQGKVTEWG